VPGPAGGYPRHGGPRTTAAAAWWRPSRAPARRGPRWIPASPRCGAAAAAQHSRRGGASCGSSSLQETLARGRAASLRNYGWGTSPSPAAPRRYLIAEGTRPEAPRGKKRRGRRRRRGGAASLGVGVGRTAARGLGLCALRFRTPPNVSALSRRPSRPTRRSRTQTPVAEQGVAFFLSKS
jgi:hypothetical protein